MSEPVPIPYAEFRTGLTYGDVYYLIWNRPHKRRNGVLGYWRELKLKMYAEYLYENGFQEADGIELRGDS